MTEPAPVLQLVSVSKRFDGVVALEDASIDVPRSRTTVLLGPSGCGKTTALRLMLGLITPDAGQVLFPQAPLTRSQMGYVVQDGGLFPHLTARENVQLMARHLSWPPRRLRGQVAELASLVRIPDNALDRYPHELSGGQRQRVGLMRALMLDPLMLFLDEPLAALDPLVRSELQDDLAEIFRSVGKSVVLVTHDLAEAAFFGHVLVLLQDGHVVQRGSLEDLVRRPASPFVTRFVRAQRTLNVTAEGEAKA